MENCWNVSRECMSRDELFELQSRYLRNTVNKIYVNVPHYREKMQSIGLVPDDIKTVADLKNLPFTYKQDLRDTYPMGMFAAPPSEIVRIHASSGTTGKQTVVGYTQKDLSTWAECMARSITAAGGARNSVMQVAYGYGLFTGGLGAHYGAERVGASVIPASSGNTQRQIQMLKDFGTTILACTPSYSLYIAETLEEMGIDPTTLKLKSGIFGAEPWTENMRKEIEKRLDIKAYDIYGLSEIMGPGVSFECCDQSGLHVSEDHFIPEIINPETGEVLPEGVSGELVFSTVTKEGIPLLRYRTRDISSLSYDTCSCGRTLVKMSRPCGRTDDMLIIRGVNVFPSQIESVLLGIGQTSPHYMILINREGTLDTMEIQIELSQEQFSDEVKSIESLGNRIYKDIESTLGLSAKITFVNPKSLPRSEGKAKHVIDNRKLK